MTVHELKILPEYFKAQRFGHKNFEIRKNDRNFKVGDTLVLKEWQFEQGYSGQFVRRKVTYVLKHVDGLSLEYCILGTKRLPKSQ